jgi:hypothetical protein
LCGKLGDFSPNLPHNIYFFELVITYPIFTLKYKLPGSLAVREV